MYTGEDDLFLYWATLIISLYHQKVKSWLVTGEHLLSHPNIKPARFQPFSLLPCSSLYSCSFQPSHFFLPGDLCGTALKSIVEKNLKGSLSRPVSALSTMTAEVAIYSVCQCKQWLKASAISTTTQWMHLEGGSHGPPHALKSCFYKWYILCSLGLS